MILLDGAFQGRQASAAPGHLVLQRILKVVELAEVPTSPRGNRFACNSKHVDVHKYECKAAGDEPLRF